VAGGHALRVALVGIGSAARRAHLPALRHAEDDGAVRLVGVCDPRREPRDAVLAEHAHAAGFADNEAMLDATMPDVLVIATPPSAHLAEMAAAAARDVHVLCEKPLGLSDDDVSVLRSLAAAHPQLVLATVHQYRFAQPWRWIARAAAGAVRDGEAFTMHIEVERPGTDPLSAGGWRADPEHEGGILGDHSVHYLALCEVLDPGCTVLTCHRDGPGGGEVASIQLQVGRAGLVTVDVSYAGGRRFNRVRLDRPAQCLQLEWTDAEFTVTHDGSTTSTRSVPSLSDRAVVNALYSPMYDELIAGVRDGAWRARATDHTVGAARLLAAAVGLAR
jgi:predicted dehydrogenase